MSNCHPFFFLQFQITSLFTFRRDFFFFSFPLRNFCIQHIKMKLFRSYPNWWRISTFIFFTHFECVRSTLIKKKNCSQMRDGYRSVNVFNEIVQFAISLRKNSFFFFFSTNAYAIVIFMHLKCNIMCPSSTVRKANRIHKAIWLFQSEDQSISHFQITGQQQNTGVNDGNI